MERPSLECINSSIEGRYKFIKTIYKSNASPTTIELYSDSILDAPVILKRLQKSLIFSKCQNESAKREIEIQRLLHHPNIVELYDSAETSSEYLLLMEYIPRHDYFTEKIEVVRFI